MMFNMFQKKSTAVLILKVVLVVSKYGTEVSTKYMTKTSFRMAVNISSSGSISFFISKLAGSLVDVNPWEVPNIILLVLEMF